MSRLDYIISESNTEKVRRQIAFILADELSNQKDLIEAQITPTAEMLLTLESLPNRVYDERFVRPSESEFPVLNVVLVSNALNDLTGLEQQTDIARFGIECYSTSKSSSSKDGDSDASAKLQRLLMLCRHIIMSPYYTTLDFAPGFIGHVSAGNLQISQPDDGIENGYLINGQIVINVKIKETQNRLEGVELTTNATNHRLYDTEKGYYYEI